LFARPRGPPRETFERREQVDKTIRRTWIINRLGAKKRAASQPARKPKRAPSATADKGNW